MRFMVMIQADKNSEAGVMPSEELLTEMGKYNEALMKAGVLLAGEGLHPSSKGALEYIECVGDDVKMGKITSFPQSVKLKSDETVVFSWIVFKSRAHRDRVNAKVMKDPRLATMGPNAMPFDGKRMVYGGFKVLVDA